MRARRNDAVKRLSGCVYLVFCEVAHPRDTTLQPHRPECLFYSTVFVPQCHPRRVSRGTYISKNQIKEQKTRAEACIAGNGRTSTLYRDPGEAISLVSLLVIPPCFPVHCEWINSAFSIEISDMANCVFMICVCMTAEPWVECRQAAGRPSWSLHLPSGSLREHLLPRPMPLQLTSSPLPLHPFLDSRRFPPRVVVSYLCICTNM